MTPRPVLFALRSLNLGDLLVAVPALRALRRRFPEHRLVLGASGRLRPLVEQIDAVDMLWPHVGLTPPELPAELRPDLAVDLHGVLPQSVRALSALAPRRLIAFRCDGHPDGPSADVPGEHETRRWLRLVASVGAAGRPDDLELPLPPPGRYAGSAVVHPGAAYGSKRWPPDRFAAVARHLGRAGHLVVVTGGRGEQHLTRAVVAGAGLPPGSDLGGRTDLAALMALVAHAGVVVSGDTGVAHLASAYRTPSVVLFGPASPRLWGPPDRPYHVALWHGTEERDVLRDDPDPALLDISVAEVVDALARAHIAAS